MRITHVIPALTKGGGERVMVTLANAAADDGHEVTVVAAFPVNPELLQDDLRDGITLRFVNANGRPKLKRYVNLLPWVVRNWTWLRRQDVVHCHLTFGALFGTMVQAIRTLSGSRRPLVIETFHAVGMPIKPWQQAVSARLARGRDGYALMAQDSFWTGFAARNPRLPLAIIPNGIDTERPSPTPVEIAAFRHATGVPDTARLVGTVGRVVAERVPLSLLEAFAACARMDGAVHVMFGGDGPLLPQVRDAASACGLEGRLHTPGQVGAPAPLMAGLDVYLSVNVGPITGIAGLEAAALGIPVIALQILPDHQLGEDDWIWSDPDPVRVGGELARLLADPAARASLAARQREHVLTHFSARTMMRGYDGLYDEAGRRQAG